MRGNNPQRVRGEKETADLKKNKKKVNAQKAGQKMRERETERGGGEVK